MAMGHVILKEFHLDQPSEYFTDYIRQLHRHADAGDARQRRTAARYVPDYFLRASQPERTIWARTNNPEWKTLALDELSGDLVVPNGSIGFRWGADEASGTWRQGAATAAAVKARRCR